VNANTICHTLTLSETSSENVAAWYDQHSGWNCDWEGLSRNRK